AGWDVFRRDPAAPYGWVQVTRQVSYDRLLRRWPVEALTHPVVEIPPGVAAVLATVDDLPSTSWRTS
ncbi:MAG: hypothetical protein H7Y15_17720, partial [Pseudonocardia sp.]|nr:hypothetical protein [Pseudonocardia sp.]